MIQKPINTSNEDISPTITAHYYKAGGKDFWPRESGGILPHVAVMEITPPNGMIDNPITCASRKRGDVHKLEMGGEVANSITSINTDSMIIAPEPQCLRHRRTELAKEFRRQGKKERHSEKEYLPRTDGICSTVTRVDKDTMVAVPQQNQGGVFYKGQFIKDGDGLYLSTTEKFFRGGLSGVSRTLKAECNDSGVCVKEMEQEQVQYRIRKLTPVETGRLMGLRDNEIQAMKDCGLSNSAMYKLHGNSIVVDVLYNIFRTLFIPNQPENQPKEEINLFNYE